MSGIFPAGFDDLEKFADWAEDKEAARHLKRLNSSMEDVQAFYNVMVERVSDALKHLNQRPLDDLRADEKKLLNLCLALNEAAVAVEMHKDPNPPYVMHPSRLKAMHDNW